jgi:hypothetical protein
MQHPLVVRAILRATSRTLRAAKAEEVETEMRRMVVANRRRHPARREEEGASPLDAALAAGRSLRILANALSVVVGAIPVRRPLATLPSMSKSPYAFGRFCATGCARVMVFFADQT